ncbi:radical SAM domain protein [Methylocaldum marinum]|uniref:Radical SAM domain protein n=1 Tax=Methylocaldum marinum TaxID=1432792 RepID=A0A250KMH9_9GAMM|nr:radical SAM domain protein [Methylocaldum marinum]
MHPHIYEMIEYIGQRNIGTNLSTNFNKISPQNIDRLINSGLEYLILSIDGISQETYSKYRVGGNIETVLDNVRTLVKRRSELKSSTPYIEWQFIVFEHNAKEVDAARMLAAELGVNRFRVIPPGLPFDAENPDELRDKWFVKNYSSDNGGSVEEFRDVIDTACLYMYRSFTVNPDGHTAPCCIVYGTHNDFGDINKEGFRSIWNNARYRSARSQYRANGQVAVPTVCDRCNIFRKKTPPPQSFFGSHSPPQPKDSE